MAGAPLKPKMCWRNVDTLVVWPHGYKALEDLVAYLNSLCADTEFTVEIEQQGCLPFLDLMLIIWPDGTLAHLV